MIKKLFFSALLLMTGILYSQTVPTSYELGEKQLSKITDLTPTSNSIIDIVVADNDVWLGTSRGVSKTTDNGASWVNYFNDAVFGTDNVSAIGFYDGMIWAATATSQEIDGASHSVGTGIKYSSDNGATWQSFPQPVDAEDDTIVVYGINQIRALPITVAVDNLTYDIAFTPGTVWIASFAGELRKSTDKGATWQRVVLPPDNLNEIKPTDTLSFNLQPVSGKFGSGNLNHRLFSVIAVDDTTLYVGTAGGINKSTDGGISWKKFNHLNQDEPISGDFVVALGYDKATKWIWAATWKAEGQTESYAISASSNGGETWQIFLPGEKAHNFGFKYIGSGLGSDYVHVFAPTDNGMFRTSNLGSTWIAAPSISDDDTKVKIETSTFYSAAAKKINGSSSDLWLGSSNGLSRLTEANGFWEGEWKVFLASPGIVNKSETFAFPNPFSPDIKPVKIKYTTGSPSSEVTLRIFDFGMNLVKTLIQNASRRSNMEQYEVWDGRDDANRIVPNGVYFYRIDIGSEEPLFGKIMVLR